MSQPHHYINLKQRAKMTYNKLLLALVILVPLILSVTGSRIEYDRQASLLEEFYSTGGCAEDNCPDYILQQNPQKYRYYSHYPEGSKMRMRAYCTQFQDTIFKCK